MGLLDGIKSLGIDDLTEKEVAYLMRVLTKPELDGAIVVPEFLQIMENLGLYEDGEGGQNEDESTSQYSPDRQPSKPNIDSSNSQLAQQQQQQQ